jgi:hypothetical protein
LPEGDDQRVPPFSDTDAIIAMFLEEDMREWSAEWPRCDEPADPMRVALDKAKLGHPADLIRIVESTMLEIGDKKTKKRGRPKLSEATRLDTSPLHRVASMVPCAEGILKSWYPGRLILHIRPVACEVVAVMWHFNTPDSHRPSKMAVKPETLLNYLARSKRNRRRVA